MAFLNTTSRDCFSRSAARSISGANFARIIFALFAVLLPFLAGAQTVSSEYKIKAVFLFNFVQFVEWPESAYPDAESPTIIGVLGSDPFGKTLEETVQGEVIRNRKIEVRRYKSVKEIGQCHVLFVNLPDGPKMNSALSSLKGRSILTVSDVENFAVKQGGIIRLYTEKNKIRLRINLETAKAEDLSISSKLLQLAEIVPVEKNP